MCRFAVRNDGLELAPDERLVLRRSWHHFPMSAGIGKDPDLEIVDDHREQGAGGKLVETGLELALGDIKCVARGHAARAVDHIGEFPTRRNVFEKPHARYTSSVPPGCRVSRTLSGAGIRG